MAIYAIGDVHGCYNQLLQLLDKINFCQSSDQLWFVGDLVNRGPQSVAVLKLLKSFPKAPIIVLGNHDLHVAAFAHGIVYPRQVRMPNVPLTQELKLLCSWLLQHKLFHFDPELNIAMVHAGIPPQWDVQQCLAYSQEVELKLRSTDVNYWLQNMYGDYPKKWSDNIQGLLRWRIILNYFTRMRLCATDGYFKVTDKLTSRDLGLMPWFKLTNRKTKSIPIIFGHWSALMGDADVVNVYALDTGCVWGGRLTALCLDNRILYSVPGFLGAIPDV